MANGLRPEGRISTGPASQILDFEDENQKRKDRTQNPEGYQK